MGGLERVGLEAVFETAEFQRGLKIYQQGIDAANNAATTHSNSLSSLGSVAGLQWGIIAGAAQAATNAMINAIGDLLSQIARLGTGIVNVGIDVESAFAGVLKTTDNLVDDMGQLTPLGEQVRQAFRDLALEVPQDLPSLMHVGELAGQLGIADDQLVEFTRTMAALGVSTNLTADEAAFAIAKIQNIFNVSTDQMAENASRFGSAIVALGNNFATTEADIVAFSQRIAGAGQIAGLTEADVAGIGAALSSLGVEAEAGGTAVQKVLLAINEAAIKGGKGLDTFAKTAGLSASEFKKLWQEDAAGAFQLFVEGLGQQGDNAIFTLEQLGLTDQRLLRSFLSLAGGGDLLGQAIDTSNKAFAENNALAIEASRRYATVESKIQMFKNAMADAALTIADQLMPILGPAIDAVAQFVQAFTTGPLAAFTTELTNMFAALQNGAFAKEFLPALAGALERLTGLEGEPDFSWLSDLGDAINQISGFMAQLLNAASIGEFFAILTNGNQDAINFLGALGTAFVIAQDVIASFVDVIVGDVWPELQGAFQNLTDLLGKFGLDWGDVWNAIQTAITIVVAAIGVILVALIGIVVGIVGGVASALDTMTQVWEETSQNLFGIIEGIIKIVVGLGLFIQKLFSGDFVAAGLALQTVFDGVFQVIEQTFAAIVNTIIGSGAIIVAFFVGLGDAIIDFFVGLYNRLVGHSIVPDMIDEIIDTFKLLVTEGPKVFGDMVSGILKSAGDLLSGITDVMTEVGSKVLDVIGGIFSGGAGSGPGVAGGDIGASLIAPILESIAQLELLFNTAIFNMQTAWMAFYTTLTTSLTLLPLLFEPLLVALYSTALAMEGIFFQIQLLALAFQFLTASAATAGAAFATNFAQTALAGFQAFASNLKLQIDFIDFYWLDLTLHMVGHWRDFIVVAQDLTAEFVFKTIQQFDQFHNVTVGKIHDVRNEFRSSFNDIVTQLDTQLGPGLAKASSGFSNLSNAAQGAAEKVAASMDSICAAVQKANGCITGSPELIIQHPFDRFNNFMGDFDSNFNRRMDSVLAPIEELERVSAMMSGHLRGQTSGFTTMMSALPQPTSGPNVTNNEYTIGPNYQQPQSPVSVIDDIILANKLAGAT